MNYLEFLTGGVELLWGKCTIFPNLGTGMQNDRYLFIFQGLIKRRSLIKDGNRPIITIWRRYWMQIWGDALVLYAAKLFAQGESRDTFRNDPCKYVTITGWHILVDVNR